MEIRRLGWAGFELTSDQTTIVIDLIQSWGPFEHLMKPPLGQLPDPSRPVDAALVTHLHEDHCDPVALAKHLRGSGPVLRPHPLADAAGTDAVLIQDAEAGLREHGLETDALHPWETRQIGPFTVTALPAVDGFGDPQVSWLVEADGQRVVHAGDTLFHGSWWSIALRAGRVDVALLPINGAVCSLPDRQPASPFAAVMDPHRAVAAANILQAGVVVPMHYDDIQVPPFYVQVDNPTGQLTEAAADLDVAVQIVAPGEAVELATASAGDRSAAGPVPAS